MGVVYRARQTKLNRIVAIKMIVSSGGSRLDRVGTGAWVGSGGRRQSEDEARERSGALAAR